MITKRSSFDRGSTRLDWLKSYHTFSFGDYYDPQHMSFGPLRVINDDIITPGKGFATHPHRDMEIITYVLEGALEHKDNLGNGSVIRPGEVQRMSAGTGITHSEFNHSKAELVHLLQIWFLPKKEGLTPGYEQKAFPFDQKSNQLLLVASPNGDKGSVTIHQDVRLYAGRFSEKGNTVFELEKKRSAWIQVASGRILINGEPFESGDGAAIEKTNLLEIKSQTPSEILLFSGP